MIGVEISAGSHRTGSQALLTSQCGGITEKKSIPKFEDIMADIAPTGSEPGVEAQPELQMEARPAESTTAEEEQGDITLDSTVPLRYVVHTLLRPSNTAIPPH